MHTEGNVVIFNTKEDETDFIEWRDRHKVPEYSDDWSVAFIANVPFVHSTNSGYVVKVHSSPFQYLQAHKNYVNETFYKACSTDREALQNWLDKNGPFKGIEDVKQPLIEPPRGEELLPPEGFRTVKLRDIADIHQGITFKIKDVANPPLYPANTAINYSEIYIVNVKDIQNDGNLDTAFLEKQNVSDGSIFTTKVLDAKYVLQPDDILVAAYGKVDKIPVAIVPHSLPENIVFAQTLIRIRVNANLANPQNVFTFLQSDTGQLIMRNYASTIAGISRNSASSIGQISVFLPPLSDTREVDIDELSFLSQIVHQLRSDILPALELVEQSKNILPTDSQQLESIAGRLKELATILSPPPLADKVLNNYPMPIALAYRRFLEAQFNTYEQVPRLKDLFEAISFFVYNVVLADTLQRLDPRQYYVADKGARKAYNGYSMSTRMDFVSAIIDSAKPNNGKDLFLPELIKSSIVDFAKELQDDLRNQLSHTATSSESQQRNTLKKYQPIVEQMLSQLEFLPNYPLVRLPSFYSKGKRLHCRMEIYNGVIPRMSQEVVGEGLEPIYADYDHIVLLDNNRQVLDLHPFYQILANEDTRHEAHLCFFKQRKAADRRLEGESVQGAFNLTLDGFDDLDSILAIHREIE
jgi:hypothetical protein